MMVTMIHLSYISIAETFPPNNSSPRTCPPPHQQTQRFLLIRSYIYNKPAPRLIALRPPRYLLAQITRTAQLDILYYIYIYTRSLRWPNVVKLGRKPRVNDEIHRKRRSRRYIMHKCGFGFCIKYIYIYIAGPSYRKVFFIKFEEMILQCCHTASCDVLDQRFGSDVCVCVDWIFCWQSLAAGDCACSALIAAFWWSFCRAFGKTRGLWRTYRLGI